MLHKLIALIILGSIVLSAAGCATAPTPTAVPAAPPTKAAAAGKAIVLSEIASDPAKKIKAFQPMADYLGSHLEQFGIGSGQVKVAPDQATMIKWLKDGTVDLYFASPYPAMIMNDQAGAPILLRSWKSGVPEYKTMILVRKDSGLTSLADLKGKMIAFDEPTSTTAYMLPLAYLLQAGLKTSEKASAESAVAADEVGYVFASGQSNVSNWLVTGKVAAGAFSDQDLKDIPADVMDQLTAIAETETLPRYLVLTRPGMDQAETEAIKALLLGVDKTAEGTDILKAFDKTLKFDELPEPDKLLARMHELYTLVSNR